MRTAIHLRRPFSVCLADDAADRSRARAHDRGARKEMVIPEIVWRWSVIRSGVNGSRSQVIGWSRSPSRQVIPPDLNTL
jgi:hypothetical protein